MANLSISKISQRIFNSSKHEATVARSSNPFAKSSFKGNVLTADVFESASKSIEKAPVQNKLTMSALVGSISNLGSRLHAGIESIAAFGNRMKDSVVNTWNKLNNIEISFDEAGKTIYSKFNSIFENNSSKALAKRPVSELSTMLQDAITDYSSVVVA